jgi:hypothetical protein
MQTPPSCVPPRRGFSSCPGLFLSRNRTPAHRYAATREAAYGIRKKLAAGMKARLFTKKPRAGVRSVRRSVGGRRSGLPKYNLEQRPSRTSSFDPPRLLRTDQTSWPGARAYTPTGEDSVTGPRALALSDKQLALLQRAAASLPVGERDHFLQSVAAHLTGAPTDDAVIAAINAALDAAAVAWRA